MPRNVDFRKAAEQNDKKYSVLLKRLWLFHN